MDSIFWILAAVIFALPIAFSCLTWAIRLILRKYRISIDTIQWKLTSTSMKSICFWIPTLADLNVPSDYLPWNDRYWNLNVLKFNVRKRKRRRIERWAHADLLLIVCIEDITFRLHLYPKINLEIDFEDLKISLPRLELLDGIFQPIQNQTIMRFGLSIFEKMLPFVCIKIKEFELLHAAPDKSEENFALAVDSVRLINSSISLNGIRIMCGTASIPSQKIAGILFDPAIFVSSVMLGVSRGDTAGLPVVELALHDRFDHVLAVTVTAQILPPFKINETFATEQLSKFQNLLQNRFAGYVISALSQRAEHELAFAFVVNIRI